MMTLCLRCRLCEHARLTPSICLIAERRFFVTTGNGFYTAQVPPGNTIASSLRDLFADVNPQANTVEVQLDNTFENEQTYGEGTGFLVAPDVIMTAGHVVVREDGSELDWRNYYAVFDFKVDAHGAVQPIPAHNVRVIERYVPASGYLNIDIMRLDLYIPRTLKLAKDQKVRIYGADFAILQLAPWNVHGTAPPPNLALRSTQPTLFARPTGPNPPIPLPNDPSSVFTIGHPWGAPAKYVDGGALYQLPRVYEQSPLDPWKMPRMQYALNTTLTAYGGSSGSPVFDKSVPPQVVGIIQAGDVVKDVGNPNTRKGFELITVPVSKIPNAPKIPNTPKGYFLSIFGGNGGATFDSPLRIQALQWDAADVANSIVSAAQRVDWIRPLVIDPALGTTTVSVLLLIESRPGSATSGAWKITDGLLIAFNDAAPGPADVWHTGTNGAFTANANAPYVFTLGSGLAHAGVHGVLPAAFNKISLLRRPGSPGWTAADAKAVSVQIVVKIADNAHPDPNYVMYGPLQLPDGNAKGAAWSIDIPYRLDPAGLHNLVF